MRAAVKSVAECFPTTIISGRSRDKVHELVGLNELYYAGSHGMDIMFPLQDTPSIHHSSYIRSTDKQVLITSFKFLSLIKSYTFSKIY